VHRPAWLVVVLCSLFVAGPPARLFAQEPPEFELPEVISPGRRPQRAAASPASVTVLTAADLRRLGARTVGEAIGFVPEAGDQREIDGDGFARLAPSQDRETANEAEAPTARFTDRLQVGRRVQERVHARSPIAFVAGSAVGPARTIPCPGRRTVGSWRSCR